MIVSPCRNCEKRYLDKDICIKTCPIMAALQDELIRRNEPEHYFEPEEAWNYSYANNETY